MLIIFLFSWKCLVSFVISPLFFHVFFLHISYLLVILVILVFVSLLYFRFLVFNLWLFVFPSIVLFYVHHYFFVLPSFHVCFHSSPSLALRPNTRRLTIPWAPSPPSPEKLWASGYVWLVFCPSFLLSHVPLLLFHSYISALSRVCVLFFSPPFHSPEPFFSLIHFCALSRILSFFSPLSTLSSINISDYSLPYSFFLSFPASSFT